MLKTEFISFLVLLTLFLFQLIAHWFNKSNRSNESDGTNRTDKNKRIYRNIFFFAVLAVFLYYFYLVYAQYIAWRDGGELLKRLVPPYQSITYVFGYHFIRFALYYLISLLVATAFLSAASYFNRKFGYRFFESEEPYLGALAIFLLGDPRWRYAWIYYLIALLILAVSGSLVVSHWLKKSERFSLYWLWLPTAILVILIESFISFQLR